MPADFPLAAVAAEAACWAAKASEMDSGEGKQRSMPSSVDEENEAAPWTWAAC